MTHSITKQHILITGGAKGIGAMITNHMLKTIPSCHIYIVQRSEAPESYAEIFADFDSGRHDITWISADLAKMGEIERVTREIATKTSVLHVLVNNSGATWGEPIEKHSELGYNKVMDLNLKAPFFLTQKCLPLLRAGCKESKEASRIVNIGSINGLQAPLLPTFAYSASKAGLHMLTQHMARHLAPEITCNVIACGLFHTAMTRGTVKVIGEDTMTRDIPMGRMGSERDIGKVMDLFLGTDWMTGAIVVLDGGVSLQSRF